MDLATLLVVGGMSAICLFLPTLLIGMAVFTRDPGSPRSNSRA